MRRSLITLVVFTSIILIGVIVNSLTGVIWFALAAIIALSALFIYHGLVSIPSNPPHCGVVTFFGKRTKEIMEEGIKFLPFNKILFDVILIKITRKNLNIPPIKVRTPDRAEIEVDMSLTYTPSKKNLISFLNAEEATGVETILKEMIEERIRTWAISGDEGPTNWEEAMASKGEALAVLIKRILGDNLNPIPSDIPTAILIKYLSKPQIPPNKNESREEHWGEDWKKVDEYFEKLDEEEKKDLEEAIYQRLKIIDEIGRGEGSYSIPSLGITIHRINLSKIEVTGETAKAAEQQAKEIQQKKAEEEEMNHVVALSKKIAEALEIPNEQALLAIQITQGKVTEHVDKKQIDISAEMLKTVESLVKFFGGNSGGGK